MKKSYLIVLEGPDLSGKSTQSNLLNQNLKNSIILKEPTDKKNGKILRENLKEKTLSKKEEIELFLLDRIEHQDQINHLLNERINVIMDRYHYSTIAYQITNNRLKNYYLELVDKLNYFKKLRIPDLTFIIQIDYDTFLKRKKKRKESLDSFEIDEKLMNHVINFYNSFTKDILFGFGPIVKINGNRDENSVQYSILNITQDILFW